MSRTAWPKLCTLAEASRLFAEQGVQVHRSNLSRFCTSRNVPRVDGKVDPEALFKAFTNDFGRQVMAGQTATPVATAPAAQTDDEPLARDDPKRDLARINAQRAQLELSRDLGDAMPTDEVYAAFAEACADLGAAMTQAAREEAARLLADIGAPGHKIGAAIAALKRYADRGREAFAASAKRQMEALGSKESPARARMDAHIAYAMEMRRGDSADDDTDAEPGASAA